MKKNIFYHPKYNQIVIAYWNKKDFGYSFDINFRKMHAWKRCMNYDSFVSKGFVYIGKIKEQP